MHTEMWEHPAVVENIATLRRRGVHVVEPAVGRLAGGDSGAGRLADPIDIVAAAARILDPEPRRPATSPAPASSSPPAGPASRSMPCGSSPTAARASRATPSPPRRRPVAPTSCSSAPSIGPSHPASPSRRSKPPPRCKPPSTARRDADVIVMAAAVADFRPRQAADGKLKKRDGVPEIVLEPTPDILAGARRSQATGAGPRRVRRRDERPRWPTPSPSWRPSGSTSSSPTTSASRASGFGYDTNAVLLLRPDLDRSPSTSATSATSPAPSSTPSSRSAPSPESAIRPP